MRDVLFISHATPDDNDFAVWLATKLELFGFKVWIDVNSLNPASDFWNTIETTIREHAIKFIFVATKSSTLRNRDGVEKELAVADRTRRTIPEFIVPVRADDVSFNEFPTEILRLNAIDFNGNWAKGLADLIEYLDKNDVPRTNESVEAKSVVERWLSIKATTTKSLIDKSDYYISNIFPTKIPKYLFVYRTEDVDQVFYDKHFTRRKIKELICTFVCPKCVQDALNKEIEYEQLKVEDIITQKPEILYILDSTIKAPANICIDLLNRCICDLFYKRGMRKFSEADGKTSKQVYYFKLGTNSKRSINSRTMSLAGKRKENYWHYALSAYFTVSPVPAYIIKWHLVFTDSKSDLLSTHTQITARRSKGKTFFNKQWLNLLKTAMFYLADGKEQIYINPCCSNNPLEMSATPLSYISSIGYIEPKAERVEDDDE